MQLDAFNMNEFIRVNGCEQVNNRFYLGSDGLPSEDGLFSTKIFGKFGSEERKNNFGFIDLRRKFFHPMVYITIFQMFRALPLVLAGDKYVRLDQFGNLVVSDDPEQGECGIDFFVKNWKKIKWVKEGTINASREKKDELLNMLKFDEIFLDKWLVIPAYYRDVNFSSQSGSKKITVEGVNALYIKLLNAATSEAIIFENSYITQSSVQNLLVEIHKELTQKIAGKKGVIRQAIMGKSIDYSTIGVLSCSQIKSNTPETQQIPYNYFGVPLHLALNLFYPFIIKWIEDFFHEYEHSASIVLQGDERYDLQDTVYETISSANIQKIVNGYIKDKTKRIRTQAFRLNGVGDRTPIMKNIEGIKGLPDRHYTLTDFLYDAAIDVCRDKHVIATRFPVTGPESVITCRVKILTTEKTVDVSGLVSEGGTGNKNFKDYPFFPTDGKNTILEDKIQWIDTYVPNFAYMKGLGGDYDGDTMRVAGLFSAEANIEAEKIMFSPMNYMDTQGNFIRGIHREGGLALYMLTKE